MIQSGSMRLDILVLIKKETEMRMMSNSLDPYDWEKRGCPRHSLYRSHQAPLWDLVVQSYWGHRSERALHSYQPRSKEKNLNITLTTLLKLASRSMGKRNPCYGSIWAQFVCNYDNVWSKVCFNASNPISRISFDLLSEGV